MPSFRRGRPGTSSADPGKRALSFSELQARQQGSSTATTIPEDPTPPHEPPPAGKGEERWIQRGISGAHMS
jgi:hypothetical protein